MHYLSRLEAGGSTSRRSNPMTDERILDVRAEPPGAFTWEYIGEGPEVWRVRIGRPTAPPVAPAAGA